MMAAVAHRIPPTELFCLRLGAEAGPNLPVTGKLGGASGCSAMVQIVTGRARRSAAVCTAMTARAAKVVRIHDAKQASAVE